MNNLSSARMLLIFNGACVALIGLVSGIGLIFEVLDVIAFWPILIELESGFPGTQKGWQLAHVAGLTNGILMMTIALILPHIEPGVRSAKWIVYSLIYTGWGNTLFFHFANFSTNRALAIDDTRLGSVDTAGILGYIFGASTIPFTIIAITLVVIAAYRRLQNFR